MFFLPSFPEYFREDQETKASTYQIQSWQLLDHSWRACPVQPLPTTTASRAEAVGEEQIPDREII